MTAVRLALTMLVTIAAVASAQAPPKYPAPGSLPPDSPPVEKVAKPASPAAPLPPLGAIELAPDRSWFKVPGTVIRNEPPLEFLAVTKGGPKAYESLLELDTDAETFNLACILIGLDAKQTRDAEFHFDPNPIEGDRVHLRLNWEQGGKPRSTTLGRLLTQREAVPVAEEWVYTGSGFTPDGRYLASLDGVLVGFVHDPASVIEHRTGVGLNDFGSVGCDPEVCPPLGTRVWLTVELEE